MQLDIRKKSAILLASGLAMGALNIWLIMLSLDFFAKAENRLALANENKAIFLRVNLAAKNMLLERSQAAQAELTRQMAVFEQNLLVLKNGGNTAEGEFVPPPDTHIRLQLNNIDEMWNRQKMVLNRITHSYAKSDSAALVKAMHETVDATIEELLNADNQLIRLIETDYETARTSHNQRLFWLFVVNVGFLVGIFFLIYQRLLIPLKKVSTAAAQIREGQWDQLLEPTRLDELNLISETFRALTDQVQKGAGYARQIAERRAEAAMADPLIPHSPLEKGLDQLRAKLADIDRTEHERSWRADGIRQIVEILNIPMISYKDLGNKVIHFLTEYVGAAAGGIYYVNEERERFELVGAAGLSDQSLHIPFGQGLIGRGYYHRKTIQIRDHHSQYVVRAGLFEAHPPVLLVVPFALHHKILAVVELGFMHDVPDYQIDFLERIGQTVASTIIEVQHRLVNQELLVKTQHMADNLQTQEEELRENYEQLIQVKNELSSRMDVLDATAIVTETDLYGTITYCNDQFLRVTGYTRAEVIGKPHNIVRHPDNPQEMYREMWETIKSGRVYRATFPNLAKDGSTYWVDASVAPVLGADGRIAKYIAIRYDVTERILKSQELFHSRQLLAEYSENLEQKIDERTAEISTQKKEIEHKNEQIQASIRYAKRLQEAMLPLATDIRAAFDDAFILFKPKDLVSGDFYWFHQQGHRLIIAVGDCTGHGVPGALMSMAGSSKLSEIVRIQEIYDPERILYMLHRAIRHTFQQKLHTDLREGMDIACCTIDLHRHTLEYAGANNPMIYIQNGELNLLTADKQAVGGAQSADEVFFQKKIVQLNQHTTCYLFSDGFQDQFGGPEGRKFMFKRMRELLHQIHHLPMDKQKQILAETITEWQGTKEHQTDDIMVMGFCIGAPVASTSAPHTQDRKIYSVGAHPFV